MGTGTANNQATESLQALTIAQIRNSDRAVDQGVLTYTTPLPLRAGEEIQFSVSLTDIGKKSPKQAIPTLEVAKTRLGSN